MSLDKAKAQAHRRMDEALRDLERARADYADLKDTADVPGKDLLLAEVRVNAAMLEAANALAQGKELGLGE